jgi:type I restriction enzyme S subunit
MSFPRYPAYKDSGVEWLGEVPGHWGTVPLKYLVAFRSGGTPSKENLDYWKGNIPWASAKDLKAEILTDTTDHITSKAIEAGAAELVPCDAVLVVVRGMILARMFPVAVAAVPIAINQDLKALIPRTGIETLYLARCLQASSEESTRRIDEAGHGTKALRMDAWTSMELPVPPVAEQTAIATFLDRETAKIDALVAEYRTLIELLKEKRQAVISHAVTKGLDPTVPMKDSGVEWLGEVPETWAVGPLKRVGWFKAGAGFPHEAQGVEGEELDFHKVASLATTSAEGFLLPSENTVSRETARQLGAFIFPARTLVFAKIVAALLLGRIRQLQGPACIDNNMMGFVVNESDFHVCFVRYSMHLVRFDLLANPGAVPSLNEGQIATFVLPWPDRSEQTAIVIFLDRYTAKLDALVTEATEAISLLQERRTALISAAVTGKIDVRGLVEQEAA